MIIVMLTAAFKQGNQLWVNGGPQLINLEFFTGIKGIAYGDVEMTEITMTTGKVLVMEQIDVVVAKVRAVMTRTKDDIRGPIRMLDDEHRQV